MRDIQASGGPTLTLDLGNSTLDCMLHGESPDRVRLPRDRCDALSEWLGTRIPTRILAVSVVPGALDAVRTSLGEHDVTVLVAPADLPCPLGMAYETPETLGADRWLSALAAFRVFGAAVIADLGSATTVNAVDAEGVFRGGCIAPGLDAMGAGLAVRTPHLPAVEPAVAAMPPRSTAAGLAAGQLLGYAGLVDRLLVEMQEALGSSAPLLVTGGRAPRVIPHLRSAVHHAPDLVHRGLLLAWEAVCSS